MLRIPSVSVQYLTVPVTGTDLTGDVEIAIIPTGVEEPAEDDWAAAAWDASRAKILIGPGTAMELPDGLYRIWVRVSAAPEKPVLPSSLLQIT